MKHALLLAAVSLASLWATGALAADRAIWTWERESYRMVGDAGVTREALRFLRSKGIRTVYLYADAYRGRSLIERQPELYREFLARVHRRNMRAHALLGSYYQHTEEYALPEKRAEVLHMLQGVLAYNTTAAPNERFDGISLDIEPHMLKQWGQRRTELLHEFLDLGQALMALKRDSGQDLPIGAAIPFWFDGIMLDWNGRERPVSEHVLDLYDYVVLMDYRDHAQGPDGIIAHAASELAYARDHGRTVVVGVEVTRNEVKKVTFSHRTETELERELKLAERAFRRNPAFGGFALHHYRSYRLWLEQQAPAGPR